jgi:uncharacterized Zn finger protein
LPVFGTGSADLAGAVADLGYKAEEAGVLDAVKLLLSEEEWMYGYGGYKKYESVESKKAKAAKSIQKLLKKNPNLAPIEVSGRKLTKTWWGMAWTENLERYADFGNRIGRGRSYVRQGAVLDLQIESGCVRAIVQGSRAKPYDVVVQVKPLDPVSWRKIVEACSGNLSSLEQLISGKFPAEMADLFRTTKTGLFPSPREIDFGCSCPDWADMCKHVAAVLYGIGIRFDEDPTLFFKLRQVEIDDLISDAVKKTSDTLIDKSKSAGKSKRALSAADDDLAGLFGVDMNLNLPKSDASADAELDADTDATEGVADGAPDDVSATPSVPETAPATPPAPKKRGRPRKSEQL